MFKLALGVFIGYQLGAKFSGVSKEDILGMGQQVLASEKVSELIRAVTGAAGDGIRTLGTMLAEEVPARLAERSEREELLAA